MVEVIAQRDPVAAPRLHRLEATADTTVVGVIDAGRPPVLTIASGDEVELSTLHLWGGGVTDRATVADMARLRDVNLARGALGPHTLTGPIAITEARAGDVLRVEILELVPGPHGFNMIIPGARSQGALAERFPAASIRHYSLDRETMTTEAAPGVTIPLRPFLGVMGVAPPDEGPRGSGEPGPFGGNIDLRELVVGTALRLPVFRAGAGFYAGDAHACQGDGEVNQSALETTMERARLRLTVERGRSFRLPRADTPEQVILLAFDRDLERAARRAVGEAVDLIAACRRIDPADAYRLCSFAVDLSITQMVNGVKGVHAKVPRALLAEDIVPGPDDPARR